MILISSHSVGSWQRRHQLIRPKGWTLLTYPWHQMISTSRCVSAPSPPSFLAKINSSSERKRRRRATLSLFLFSVLTFTLFLTSWENVQPGQMIILYVMCVFAHLIWRVNLRPGVNVFFHLDERVGNEGDHGWTCLQLICLLRDIICQPSLPSVSSRNL